MSDTILHVSVHEHLAELRLDRLRYMNALDVPTLEAMEAALDIVLERPDVGGVIVTGTGPAFVTGAQISELAQGAASMLQLARTGQRLFTKLQRARKPIIAAVNGSALGGGCELALACHLRVAAHEATFGQPEVKLGLLPGWGGTQRLARCIGSGRALELLLTGDTINAQEAHRIGLVGRVVPGAQLLAEARNLLRRALANAPLALRACLDTVDVGLQLPLEQALAYEAQQFELLTGTADALEGTRAFVERRVPSFIGR